VVTVRVTWGGQMGHDVVSVMGEDAIIVGCCEGCYSGLLIAVSTVG